MNKQELELGASFAPKFDENGLIPVIAQHFQTKAILMLAYMNEEALQKTIQTKKEATSIWIMCLSFTMLRKACRRA